MPAINLPLRPQASTRMSSQQSLLLQLPDACLLVVLRCCADDLRALFSAGRAHSRLYCAASIALDSIKLNHTRQHQLDGVLLYLAAHGQHVGSLDLHGYEDAEGKPTLRQLPPNLQLTSLQLDRFNLQLQPGHGFQGVLGAAAAGAAALKQLRLHHCELQDRQHSTAALLQLRAGLEHLSITGVSFSRVPFFSAVGCHLQPASCSTGVLQQLQCLTYLELTEAVTLQCPYKGTPDLRFLRALTRLVDLRLVQEFDAPRSAAIDFTIAADMLSDTLTRLELSRGRVEPGALSGKTLLQHLHLRQCACSDAAAGTAYLLSPLQHLQQLTHLGLVVSLAANADGTDTTAASAYSALTASSKLQSLRVSRPRLPAGVWQHVFPAGRQLPHLQSLCITDIQHPAGGCAPFPECSRLVSCCPDLQSLEFSGLQYRSEQLPVLRGLSGLHTLVLTGLGESAGEEVGDVCQLTGLRALTLYVNHSDSPQGWTQLTQLQQLTSVRYCCMSPTRGGCKAVALGTQAPGEEPVWRQILRGLVNNTDPQVAQQAAAALEQCE